MKADAPFGVVINHFSTEDIPHLGASLLFAAALSLQDPLVREVVVVDGSRDRDERLCREVERLGARYHHEGKVLGFAEGYNVGARLLTAPWLVLSASDVYPALDFYAAADALIRDAGAAIGCIVPRLTKSDLPIQQSDWSAQSVCAIPLMTLNLNVFEREAFFALGGVPERYSGAYNDVEMSLKIRSAGRLILMLPTTCNHFGRLTLASAASNYRYAKDRDVFFSRYPDLARLGSFWDLDIAKVCGGRLSLLLWLAERLSPPTRRLNALLRILRWAPLLTQWNVNSKRVVQTPRQSTLKQHSRMRISVITPTFNAVTFIEACVDNVARQGDVVLEHIIADGGSTDGTVELIARLQRDRPALRLLPGPDRGQSDAMNKATALAQGEVIGILNADDFYEPGAVRRALEVLARVEGPALVCGDCRIVGADGETILMNRPRYLFPEGLLQDSWLFPIPANPSAYFYTKSAHDLVGGYDVDDHHAMDCEFLLSCAERVKMIYVAEHWGNFRYIAGCKTFEDAEGAARVSRLIERHKTALSAAQRARMQRLRRWVELKFKVRNRLRRLRLVGA